MFKSLANKRKKNSVVFLYLTLLLTLLVLMFPTITFANPDSVEVVTNGSFELDDFGWTFEKDPVGVFRDWQITGAGVGGFPPGDSYLIDYTAPQDGIFVAWNGFAGSGPMEFRLWQDVAIPPGVATLRWMDRIQKYFGPLGSGPYTPYTYEVQIRDPNTNSILSNVYSYSINPIGNTKYDTGWQSHSVDVSEFDGLTVRLYFVEFVAHSGLGPGQVEIDAVSLIVEEIETNQPPMDIDVKPGSWPNSINLNGNGVVPVAIFGSQWLDVNDIDSSTVSCGFTGIEAQPVHNGHIEDINGDGSDDIVFHFREGQLGFDVNTPGNTEMPLYIKAMLTNGASVEGEDIIRITPNNPNSRGKGGKGPK